MAHRARRVSAPVGDDDAIPDGVALVLADA
jgi:hypothetical protein